MSADRIYVRDFPEGFTLADLRSQFRQFGKIRVAYFKTSENGKQCAFFRFWKPTAASGALSLNGTSLGENTLYVALAENQKNRKAAQAQTNRTNGQQRSQTQVIVYGLQPQTTTEELKELFAAYGTITFASVVHNENRLYGIVQFTEAQSVSAAVAGRHKTDFMGSTLQVMRYIPKDELSNIKRVLKNAREGHKAERKTATMVHRTLQYNPVFGPRYAEKHPQRAN